eukprot:282398-Rhodomonas_salina.1
MAAALSVVELLQLLPRQRGCNTRVFSVTAMHARNVATLVQPGVAAVYAGKAAIHADHAVIFPLKWQGRMSFMLTSWPFTAAALTFSAIAGRESSELFSVVA